MSSPSLTPGSLRWAGILIVASGSLGLGVVIYILSRSGPLDVTAVTVSLVAAAALVVAAVRLPWGRWTHGSALALAVAALVLLVLVEATSGYAGSRQAAATYPLFVTLVLAWVGMTQPRRTALSFTLCVGAALAVVVLLPPRSAIPLASLAVVLPVGAALGEAAAWMMAELRSVQRNDAQRASTFIDLTRALDQLPARSTRQEVASALADTAAGVFGAAAEVTLIDPDGQSTAARSGRRPHHAGTATPGRAATRPPSASVERPLAGTASSAGGGTATATLAAPSAAPVAPRRTTITLMGHRGILGRVQLELARDPDDPYAANLVRLFAAQATSALERFELLRRLDHEITHDELTGTGNRRHATNLFNTLRNGDGIILIDVDGFKSINDTAGHLAGDELLRSLGEYLNGYVRGHDDVARLGGDEFVVVARGVGHGAAAAANRLLDGWRAQDPPATVSIGVAVHRAGDGAQVSVERADQALYQAKRAGRNQVGMGADELVEPTF